MSIKVPAGEEVVAKNALGSPNTTAFDTIKLVDYRANAASKELRCRIEMYASSDLTRAPLLGELSINPAGTVVVNMAQADTYTKINLTAPQQAAARALVVDLQNDTESGLIAIGALFGDHTPEA